jgi:hypothetical protein
MYGRIAIAALLACAIPASQATPFWGATESRQAETAPVDLKPGEDVWNAAAAPEGPVVVLVSLGEQRAYVYRNGGRAVHSPGLTTDHEIP